MPINREIDRIADDFEAAWQAGQTPRVTDYLARIGDQHAGQLLEVLIPLDMTFHRQRDRVAKPDDYAELGADAVEIARRELQRAPLPSDSNGLQDTLESPLPNADPGTTLPTPGDGGVDLTLTFMQLDETEDPIAPQPRRATPSNESLSPGQKINDRYLVEKEIGRGGMGAVFLGFDVHLQRKVAIKTIRADLTSSPSGSDSKRAFEEEARIGAGLVHPAIATVYDYGFMGHTAYTVFEYVAGKPMREFIRESAPLPIEDVRQIVGALAQALDYAHARGIVHRDLKPENIRFTEQGQPKILDLGLAVRFKDANTWRFAGTPAYASPEQASELPSDGRTDQYALAIIVYEMLSGQRPFNTKDWREMLRMHQTEVPKCLMGLRADLQISFSNAIEKALAKEPNERHANCEAFAAAIGCQFQTIKSVSNNVVLEATVTSMSHSVARSSFQLRSTSNHSAMLLEADKLWMGVDSRIECLR